MPRVVAPLVLSPDQRGELQRWLVALGTPQQVALRCRIVLTLAAGKTEVDVAAENGVNRKTVRFWGKRFRTAAFQRFGKSLRAEAANPPMMQLASRP